MLFKDQEADVLNDLDDEEHIDNEYKIVPRREHSDTEQQASDDDVIGANGSQMRRTKKK